MATVEIKGLQGVIDRLQRLGKSIDAIADNSLHKSAYILKREIETNIQSVTASYGGRTYKAVDTGALLRSIHVEKLGLCHYAIGTAIEHAPYVEFGTGSAGDPAVAHNTSDICARKNRKNADAPPKLVHFAPQPPRPYMRPAFASKSDVVTMNMSRAIINAALSGGAAEW